MKRYVEKEEETTNELSNWVGIELANGTKGAIVYIGDSRYHIICSNSSSRSNECCGGVESDGSSVEEVLNCWMNTDSGTKINQIYCFDSYKELMQWFANDIEG
jgi:hypothetical protein